MSAAIRHFETVTSHTLNISVPDEFLNRRVEVIVLSCDDDVPPPPRRPREVPLRLRNRGKILGDIMSPISPAEDWDCVRPAGDFLATIDASCHDVNLASLTGDDLRFQYLMEK